MNFGVVTSLLGRVPRPQALFAIASVLALAAEGYVVFVRQDATFSIEGIRAYDISEFADGGTVSHAFLMRGDGLHTVRIRLSSDVAAAARIQWTLWNGMPDQEMSRAFEGVESVDLRPGRQWKSISFVRNGSSNGRWYTIELRLLDVAATAGTAASQRPRVSAVASQDNPDRGGVLFVNGARQPGSLFLREDRRGRTLYRRFLAEAAPNLPRVFQIPLVQWAIVVVYHWALLVFAYAVLTDAERMTAWRATR